MAEKASGGVQSVERVFELLELITDAGGDVTLSELSSSTDLPLPTIHRLLRTLVALGYIRQLPNRRYALGPRLIRLGEGANKQLGALARPQLKSLVDRLGETSNMAVLDSDMVIYVAQVPSLHSMRMFTEVGRRVPVHCTGVGKVLLAQLPPAQVQAILMRAGMVAQTPHTITDPDRLARELDRVRHQGYAVDDAEQEVGVRCVAVAVPGGRSTTALSVSGPETRVTWAVVERTVPLLQQAAAALAGQLAGRGVTA
jgi:IclR family transcriptional regulator, acetate operon repressor